MMGIELFGFNSFCKYLVRKIRNKETFFVCGLIAHKVILGHILGAGSCK